MCNPPTALPCIAPIQFFSQDYSPPRLRTPDIEGGTVFLFEKNHKRYLITAKHVWDGMIAESERNAGRQHTVSVIDGAGRLLGLWKDEIALRSDEVDIVVLTPTWLASGLSGLEFYNGDVATVSAGDVVATWGYPKTSRTVHDSTVTCEWEELSGEATSPVNQRFKFTTETACDIGGFSGAPVFRADGKLVGVSQ